MANKKAPLKFTCPTNNKSTELLVPLNDAVGDTLDAIMARKLLDLKCDRHKVLVATREAQDGQGAIYLDKNTKWGAYFNDNENKLKSGDEITLKFLDKGWMPNPGGCRLS